MSIRDEIERIEQSNDIAYKVIEVAQNKAPGEFVTLDFRYGIADALWDAGYRKVEQADREPSGAAVEAAARAMAHADVTNPDGWVMTEEARNVYSDMARAALLAAQEVRDVT